MSRMKPDRTAKPRTGRRPESLRAVSLRVLGGEQDFDMAVREFLDAFYARPGRRAVSIAEAPGRIGPVHDAYLAAVAEHLARTHGLEVPPWSDTQGFELTRPVFAGGLDSLMATLTAESPTAFRRRLLFVSADALSRPRGNAAGGKLRP